MVRARTARWVAAVVAGTALTACGGDTAEGPATSSPATSSPASDPTGDEQATASAEPSSADGDPALDDLVAAAQAEGTLTLYGSATENVLQAVADGFTETYDIDVQFIRLSGTDLIQRFSAEAEAGSFVADVVLAADTSTDPAQGFFATSAESGWMIPLADADIPGYPWDFPDEFLRDTRAVVQIQPWLFSYNTEIVSDPPQQWPDLLDERFTDLILLPDPNSSSAYIQVWQVVLDEYGEEFFEGLRAQNLRVYESGVPATEALGAGEGGLELPSVGGLALGARDRGAPVDITVPDVTTGVEMALAMPTPAEVDHPNAARLFAHYIMSPEGNAAFNDFDAVFSVYDSEGLPSKYSSPPIMDEDATAHIFELLGIEQN